MSIYKPTWLYIKQHSITGLKYFGKTTKDPIIYQGSGKYWLNHIKHHGKEHVLTIWSKRYDAEDEIRQTAEALSVYFDIVKSKNWANLCNETGMDGGRRDNNHLRIYNSLTRPENHCASISKRMTGKRYRIITTVIDGIEFDSLVAAATHFGVSETTIRNWYHRGRAIRPD